MCFTLPVFAVMEKSDKNQDALKPMMADNIYINAQYSQVVIYPGCPSESGSVTIGAGNQSIGGSVKHMHDGRVADVNQQDTSGLATDATQMTEEQIRHIAAEEANRTVAANNADLHGRFDYINAALAALVDATDRNAGVPAAGALAPDARPDSTRRTEVRSTGVRLAGNAMPNSGDRTGDGATGAIHLAGRHIPIRGVVTSCPSGGARPRQSSQLGRVAPAAPVVEPAPTPEMETVAPAPVVEPAPAAPVVEPAPAPEMETVAPVAPVVGSGGNMSIR